MSAKYDLQDNAIKSSMYKNTQNTHAQIFFGGNEMFTSNRICVF